MKKKKGSVFFLALSLVLVTGGFLYMRGGDSLAQQAPDISPPVGETIQFGNLNWLVLEIDGDRALILSEKVLENKPYHSPGGSITWENCTLREYLNGSFYNNTFNDEEKERIIETEVANKANGRMSGGNNTNDKVFLLSIDEVNKHMGDNGHDNIKNAKLASTWWWLRSPGGLGGGAASKISSQATLQAYFVDAYGGVRPALWMILNTEE